MRTNNPLEKETGTRRTTNIKERLENIGVKFYDKETDLKNANHYSWIIDPKANKIRK